MQHFASLRCSEHWWSLGRLYAVVELNAGKTRVHFLMQVDQKFQATRAAPHRSSFADSRTHQIDWKKKKETISRGHPPLVARRIREGEGISALLRANPRDRERERETRWQRMSSSPTCNTGNLRYIYSSYITRYHEPNGGIPSWPGPPASPPRKKNPPGQEGIMQEY
jgi:hypothetical protein